jgi:bacteriocin biosynthesis cyclodehydratase domain-containing protein
MRPKLTDSAFFAPVEGGVFVRSLSGQAVLRGGDLYRWLDRLSPYLDGEHELQALLEGVDGPRRTMVEGLVGRLADLGLVRDAGQDVVLDPAERDVYAPSIAYLEQYHATPGRVFAAFRATEVLVVGRGESALAAARTLLETGTRRLHTWTGPDPETSERLARLVDGHRERDPRCEWAALDPAWPPAIPPSCPVVVHAGGRYGDAEALELQRTCLGAGRVFLTGGWDGHQGYLGPLVRPDRPGCLSCAVTRMGWASDRERGEEGAVPALQGMVAEVLLGDLLASWVFRHLTGSPEPDRGAGLLRVDTDTLGGSTHPLLPWPGCPDCPPAAGSAPETPTGPGGDGFAAACERLVDERTGILARFATGRYQQLPVNQVEVVCRPVPATGDAGLAVVVPARSTEVARLRAARAGLAHYGRALAGAPSREGWVDPGSGAPGVEPAEWAFATGRTREEWVATGLLELGRRLTWAAVRADEATGRRELDQVPDEELLTFVKWLRVQLGCRVRAAQVDVALGIPGVAVALSADGRPAALCVDTTRDAALERALVGLVQRRQNEAGGDRAGTLDWLDASAGDLLHDLPDEGADWSSWTPAALAACERGGLEVVVQPRAVDDALTSLGLAMGHVGIRRR